MRIVFAIPLALLLGAGCHREPASPHADKAWVRLAAVPGRPAAAYLTIHGGTAGADVIAVDAPQAGSSELHRSMARTGGMMAMARVDDLPVPPHGMAAFAPGGYHVMLFGVSPQVKPGGTMPLQVRFAKAQPVTVQAKVVGAGDPAPY